jgi:hypothetical protein
MKTIQDYYEKKLGEYLNVAESTLRQLGTTRGDRFWEKLGYVLGYLSLAQDAFKAIKKERGKES